MYQFHKLCSCPMPDIDTYVLIQKRITSKCLIIVFFFVFARRNFLEGNYVRIKFLRVCVFGSYIVF